MADEKISAMPAATDVNNVDLIPIVQGGVNMSATRALLLTSASETIGLSQGDGGVVELTDDGLINVQDSDGVGFMSDVLSHFILTATPPTSDPHVVNAIYTLAGVLHVSAG
jgi:hypothetical protein